MRRRAAQDGDFSPSWVGYTPDGRHLLVGTTDGALNGYALTAPTTGDVPSFAALDTQALDQILVGHMLAICGEANQIFRELNRYDYGIDAEIEFRGPSGLPEGRKIYLQLKSGASCLRRRAGDGAESVRRQEPEPSRLLGESAGRRLLGDSRRGRTDSLDERDALPEGTSATQSRQIFFAGDDLDVAAVLLVRSEIYARSEPPATS